MTLMQKPLDDPKITRWWWRPLREWVYQLLDPLWAGFRGDNTDDVALANVTQINMVSAPELAILDGLSVTTSELNQLTGLTANAADLNRADRTAANGIAETSKVVVLDDNADLSRKRFDINQSLLDALAQGPSLWYDASDDQVISPDHEDLSITGDLTLLVIAKNGSAILSEAQGLLGKWLGSGDQRSFLLSLDANGKIKADISSTGGITNTYEISDAAVPNPDMWHAYCTVYDASAQTITIYLDGFAVASTMNGVIPASIFDSTAHLGIGIIQSGAQVWGGAICVAMVMSRALSATEVKHLSSGAPLDNADIGASQSDKITNGDDWTGATGSTPPNDWTDSGSATVAYLIRDNTGIANMDDKTLEMQVSGTGEKTLSQSVFQKGKRYRVTFAYRNLEGSSPTKVQLGSANDTVTLAHTLITGDGILVEQEFVAGGTDLEFIVYTGGILQIDGVQVVQIGCVAEYRPEGITPTQWLDSSGNGLHGQVNGAVPVNLPLNHQTRYVQMQLAGDTTLAGAVPAGYRIQSMAAQVSGASAGMILNIGTAAAGTDVINAQDISGNGLFDLNPAKRIFSMTGDQTLYLHDDGGTAWSGVKVDLIIVLERIM